MAGSRAVKSRWVRMMASVLVAVSAACLALAGTATAESAPPDIHGGSASPSSLSNEGGSVQISAEVTDDVSVQRLSRVHIVASSNATMRGSSRLRSALS